MNNDIERALTYLRDKAKEYAISLAEKEYLKEFRKSKKAILMNQAEQQGITTATKQEVYAYSHPEYQELLKGLQAAIQKEAELRHMVKAAELKIEVWRTQQANQRTERKAYNA